MLGLLPVPDGTIDAQDRLHFFELPSAIALAEPAGGVEDIFDVRGGHATDRAGATQTITRARGGRTITRARGGRTR